MSTLDVNHPGFRDPFTLESDTPPAIEDKFRASLVARAKKRSVVDSDGGWTIVGDQRLGDSYPSYAVSLDGRKYRCSCYQHDGGETRRHKVCSHVLAVILHRRSNAGSGAHGNAPVLLADVGAGLGIRSPAENDHPPVVLPRPDHIRFGLPKLPAWVTSFREHQWVAVRKIIDAFNAGNKLVFVDAPTGAGKTLIAELVRRELQAQAIYVCSTKTLQDQFVTDFPYSRVLKGRANYRTLTGTGDITCADCTRVPPDQLDCFWCDPTSMCNYQVAKRGALSSPLAVLNTSYFLSAANYVGEFNKRDLVIVDECDVLEKELMGFVELSIGERRAKQLKIGKPELVTKPESWGQWLNDTVAPAIKRAIANVPQSFGGMTSIKDQRNRKALTELLAKVVKVAPGIANGNWVFDGYNEGKVMFKPVRVDAFGESVLWRHGGRFLLMSATVISPEELVESLGFEGDYTTVSVPCTFPVENRPIHVAPVANVTNKEKDVAWPSLANAISNICDLHPGERILVHTVSYALADYLATEVTAPGRSKMTYRNAMDRDAQLQRFRETTGAVMFAPSLDRGVSLDDDQVRVIVVAKVPYLNLGDKQTSARLHTKGGQLWYGVQMVRSLVQSTGRGVRSADDWCVSYIVDKQFVTNVLKKNKALLPNWWRESLNMQFPTKQLTRERDAA